MGRLEWVTEVQEIHVDPLASSYSPTIKDVNQALSEGWRLLEVYPYHPGRPEVKGAIRTVYVLGRAEEREGERESPTDEG